MAKKKKAAKIRAQNKISSLNKKYLALEKKYYKILNGFPPHGGHMNF